MSLSFPNAPSILPSDQTSGGTLKDAANKLRYVASQLESVGITKDLLLELARSIASGLGSAQSQIDHICNALRNPVALGDPLQATDPQGVLAAQMGNMVGPDNVHHAGDWAVALWIGGSGPGDTSVQQVVITAGSISINGNQVVGPRDTGWGPVTGPTSKAGWNTGTITLPALAQVVGALENEMKAQGSIGP